MPKWYLMVAVCESEGWAKVKRRSSEGWAKGERRLSELFARHSAGEVVYRFGACEALAQEIAGAPP